MVKNLGLFFVLCLANAQAQHLLVILGSSSAAGVGATTYDSSYAGRYAKYLAGLPGGWRQVNLACIATIRFPHQRQLKLPTWAFNNYLKSTKEGGSGGTRHPSKENDGKIDQNPEFNGSGYAFRHGQEDGKEISGFRFPTV